MWRLLWWPENSRKPSVSLDVLAPRGAEDTPWTWYRAVTRRADPRGIDARAVPMGAS